MEFLVLEPDTFLPDFMIDGYDSLIWTERYLEAGEFELQTYDIANTKAALPYNSLVTHKDTKEVMIVESHSITVDDDGVKLLKTKGRTLESFLEQRVIARNSGKTFKMLQDYSSVGASEILIWNSFANTSVEDVIVGDLLHDPLDAIANVCVTESNSPGQEVKPWFVEAGYIYPKLLEILVHDDLGIRCIRPHKPFPDGVTVIDVETFTLTTGHINRTETDNVSELQFNIYNGTDRTVGGDLDFGKVILSYDQGFLVNPEYLFSNKNVKNVGFWTTNQAHETSYFDQGAETLSGLDRRYQLNDFGSTLGPDPADYTDMEDSARQKTENRVKRTRKKFFFNANASDDIPYKYKNDYDLGDLITLVAEYDTNVSAVVSEYVRTEDAEGEKGYPTLVIDS